MATTREQDERLLEQVRMRAMGRRIPLIAQRYGISGSAIREKTGKVVFADLAESGEPRGAVRAAYWDER